MISNVAEIVKIVLNSLLELFTFNRGSGNYNLKNVCLQSVLLCKSKNHEPLDLILTFPIVQQPISDNMKPQHNYRYCLRFSFRVRDWRVIVHDWLQTQ